MKKWVTKLVRCLTMDRACIILIGIASGYLVVTSMMVRRYWFLDDDGDRGHTTLTMTSVNRGSIPEMST